MHRYGALIAALLILLLAAPATPAAARTTPPAEPDAPSATFNVVRLGLYSEEEETYDQVFALGNVAFLVDNHWDSTTPPDSYGNVELYDIADAQNPHFRRVVSAAFSRTISGMDSNGYYLALALSKHGYYGSGGALEVYDNVDRICWFDFDYSTQGMAYSVAVNDLYGHVGLSRGLARMSFEGLPNELCEIFPVFPSSPVYDIVAVGFLLYLGQYDGVRVVNVNGWPPSEVAFYPIPHPVYHLAVSTANYIYAGTDYGLDIIDGASGQIVTHYGPNGPVAVAVDGATAYVGTRDDLQVLDVSDPKAPKLIGAYVDPDMDFERSLVFDSGLVHSPKGIFQYKPEPPALLLEAQSAGVAVEGTPLASGSSVVVKGGDRITLSGSGSAAAVELRCSANSVPKPELGARQVVNSNAPELTTAVIDVVLDPTLLGLWATEECNEQPSLASLLADAPALPLSLVTGGVEIQVPATAGAVRVATSYASSRAGGGTTFQTTHAPSPGVSQFVCLAGTLQVQPTAASALPLTLSRDQFVDVTAAGAGPVDQFRYVYLPLLRR